MRAALGGRGEGDRTKSNCGALQREHLRITSSQTWENWGKCRLEVPEAETSLLCLGNRKVANCSWNIRSQGWEEEMRLESARERTGILFQSMGSHQGRSFDKRKDSSSGPNQEREVGHSRGGTTDSGVAR